MSCSCASFVLLLNWRFFEFEALLYNTNIIVYNDNFAIYRNKMAERNRSSPPITFPP